MFDCISDVLNTIVKYLAGFLLAAMTVVVFLQVLFRYVFDAPLDWSEEMATFAFAWMALLGAGVGLKYNQHPSLDVFHSRFPPFLQKTAELLVNLAVMFMLIVLCVAGWQLTITMKMQTMAALGYSVAYIYIILPISALIMLFHVLVRTVNLFSSSKRRK
ncbi:MAG: TRAP transporter small permease [Desulfobacterales bacterium]|nr:MAG: TRAP transporter small permease [Desulfobacterales bacterium]